MMSDNIYALHADTSHADIYRSNGPMAYRTRLIDQITVQQQRT